MATSEHLAVAKRRVLAFDGDHAEERDMEMVREEPLALYLNGRQTAVLMRLPGQEKELAIGFCLSEGLVNDYQSILTVAHCGSAAGDEDLLPGVSRNRVDVSAREDALALEARLDVVRLIRAGCGSVDVERSELPLAPLPPGVVFEPSAVLATPDLMRSQQVLRKRTGGVHAAALFDLRGDLIVTCEDVGRHNAVDKVLGYALMCGISLADTMMLCSGRLSYEMVTKAIRMGLPLLASVSTPTALAVQLADTFNLTLIGYLRGKQMMVYSHPQRMSL